MNSITIKDKTYIFTTESSECCKCDFSNDMDCKHICDTFSSLSGSGNGIFKLLKMLK